MYGCVDYSDCELVSTSNQQDVQSGVDGSGFLNPVS